MNNTFDRPIIPENDKERLNALRNYEILNTPSEKQFDNIAKMIAKVFNVPIALISFVDEKEVFFKANVGMEGTANVDRGVSLCSLAILDSEPTVFENAKEEPCLLANPLVQGLFGLQFYAGVPLVTPDGYSIGTVCIVDKKQRFFNKGQIELLKDFTATVMDVLLLRHQISEKGKIML